MQQRPLAQSLPQPREKHAAAAAGERAPLQPAVARGGSTASAAAAIVRANTIRGLKERLDSHESTSMKNRGNEKPKLTAETQPGSGPGVRPAAATAKIVIHEKFLPSNPALDDHGIVGSARGILNSPGGNPARFSRNLRAPKRRPRPALRRERSTSGARLSGPDSRPAIGRSRTWALHPSGFLPIARCRSHSDSSRPSTRAADRVHEAQHVQQPHGGDLDRDNQIRRVAGRRPHGRVEERARRPAAVAAEICAELQCSLEVGFIPISRPLAARGLAPSTPAFLFWY